MVGGTLVRARRWLVTAASVALVLGGSPTAAYAAGGTLAGHVTDAGGAALGHVCVRASVPDDSRTVATTTTGDAGAYELPVAAGTYHVAFADCGGRDLVTAFWPDASSRWSAKTVTVGEGQRVSGIDGRLAAGGSVSGAVTDTAGTPVAGVTADIRPVTQPNVTAPAEERIRTGADGRFVARGVAPGRYRVEFLTTDTRLASVFYGDTPDAAESPEVVVVAGAASAGVDARLPRAATVAGVVRDDAGEPYAGVCAHVVASLHTGNTTQHTAVTAADGSYVVPRLAAGTYRVAFSDCGNVTARVWYPAATSFAGATPVQVAEGAAVTGVDGVFSRAPYISGVVRGSAGEPLRGVSVAVHDGSTGTYTGRSASTGDDGRYVVFGLRATVYKLRFYGSGEQPDRVTRWWPGVPAQAAAVPVSVVGGVSVDDADIVLPIGGRILGTVTAPDGQPTDAMCVYAVNPLTSQSGGTRPGATGDYVIRGLDNGSYQVFFRTCRTGNYAPAYYGGTDDPATADLVDVEVERDTVGISHRATPGAAISGRVTDTAGQPLARMCVEAVRHPRGILGPGYAATDDDGRYVITSLAPHTDYRVRAADCWSNPSRYVEGWNGGADEQADAPLVAAAAGRVAVAGDVVLRRGGTFSGTVTDQFGKPVYGVCVEGIDAGGRSRGGTHTDATGTYRTGALRPGTYTALFTDCGAGLVSSVYYRDALTPLTAVSFNVREGADTAGIDVRVLVVTAPGSPGGVGATPGDGAATLSWRAPAYTGHSPVTAYEVRDATGAVVLKAAASARSATVRGLANFTTHAFTVNAVNVKGAGDPSTRVSVVPRPPARLSVSGPAFVVSDAAAALTGRLTDPAGAAVPGARVELLGRRRGSTVAMKAYTATTTGSTGAYRFAISPAVPMEYAVRYAGSSLLAPVRVSRVVPVAPRVTWTLSGRTVYVTAAPAGGGGRARLQVRRSTGWDSVVGAYLSSTGRATLRAPSAGTYRVVVVRTGWATATGTSFTLR